jgi:hypothetical protein
MNHECSRVSPLPRSMQSMLPLLLVLAGSDAVANTYFKCVDAKGAVTVQQTGCAVSSSQEEKKVWATKAPLPQPTNEAPSAQLRRSEDSGKPKLK